MGRFRSAAATLCGTAPAALAGRWFCREFPAWLLGKRQVDPDARVVLDRPRQDLFAASQAPTLLLYGERGRSNMVGEDAARTAARINPRVRLRSIKDAGHNVRRENLADFVAAVNAFLAAEIFIIPGGE